MPDKTTRLQPKQLKQRIHTQFFPEGKKEDLTVGLELEVWPFRESENTPIELIRFYDDKGTGLIQMLNEMEDSIEGLAWEPLPNGTPRFRIGDGGQLTLEPGGQLEYSGPPKATLDEAIQDISGIIESLRCCFKEKNVWLFHSGLNPWHTIDEVGLQLQKERYIHMNNYFQSVGPYGQRMMRLSTSLQVNLDAGDPDTAQRRWLAANLLGPVFTALFGNSPFIEGKATGAHSYRSIIWQNLDPSRTGFQKEFMAPDYRPCPVEQYMDFALSANNMRVPDASGNLVFDGRFLSFQKWMTEGSNGFYPTLDDWDNHLTTLFPEVRARGFFEIRYLDAQSKVWCSVPGILLTHLLYSPEAREQVIKLLEPYRTTLTGMLNEAAIKGMNETVIAQIAKNIFKLGLDAASKIESSAITQLCERFFELYTHKNRNPASDLIELNNGDVFTPRQYRDWEKSQVDAAGHLLDMICEYT